MKYLKKILKILDKPLKKTLLYMFFSFYNCFSRDLWNRDVFSNYGNF